MAVSIVRSNSGFVDNWQSRKSLAECNLHMLTSEESCDVSFRVGKDKKTVRAHRYVLISRSCVFNAMLCGPLVEKNEVMITDVEKDVFTELLRYLYTNKSEPTPMNVTALLYLAKKYAVGGLEHLCLIYLESSLSAENACVILEQAHLFDEKQLYDRAMDVILDNGEKCLGTEGFKHLCRECFHKVISSNCLSVKAELVFSAAVSWAEEQCKCQGREITPDNLRSTLGQNLYSIPFPDMDQECYVKEVLPRQILTSDENVKIMASLMCADSDPSPFKKRLSITKTHSDNLSELSIGNSDTVILWRNHERFLSSHGGEIYSDMRFTFSHDAVLLGVYVYGSSSPDDRYHLRIGQHYRDWTINENYVSTLDGKFKERYVKTIHLISPLLITSRRRYCIHVSLLDERETLYHGIGLYEQVAEGQCVVREVREVREVAICSGNGGLIYGLYFKSNPTLFDETTDY